MDFNSFLTYKFQPVLFAPDVYFVSCGFNAAATLSGRSPYSIQKEYKEKKIKHSNENHCDETFLVDFLRKYYKVVKIDEHNVQDEKFVVNNITPNHLLLIRQSYSGTDDSYSVIWSKWIIHNFEINLFKPLELVNRPAKSIYVLKKLDKKNAHKNKR